MVLAASSGMVGLLFGLRILCCESEDPGQKTRIIFLLCSEKGLGGGAPATNGRVQGVACAGGRGLAGPRTLPYQTKLIWGGAWGPQVCCC